MRSIAIFVRALKLSPKELKERIRRNLTKMKSLKLLQLVTNSFGFENYQMHADLVFDVRFLPNPYYAEILKTFKRMRKTFIIML